MISRYFISILIVTSSFVLAIGQQTEPKAAEAPRTFAWTLDGGGSYLGVQTEEVNKENFAKFGLREVRGVAIEKVVENSPAAAAGLQAGDVIIKFNGEEVTSSRKLTRLIGEVDPDHQAKITVLRGGNDKDYTVTLAKRPAPKFENGNFTFSTPNGAMTMPRMPAMPPLRDLPDFKEMPQGEWKTFSVPGGQGRSMVWRAGEGRVIGIGVTPLTKQLASHFGVDGGVMINEVRENTPAAKAGLKAGDIIVEADGQAVKSDFDLIKTVNGKKEGAVQLTFVRDGKRQSVSVTPEASKDNGFIFQTDDKDGDTPALPAMPAMPAMPMNLVTPMPDVPSIAPMPATLFRGSRVI